ncbi:DUF4445 domain-containing protein [bacterium]|nr:MAG: DUF4445 domain-containing protein [bacterium]
MPHLPPAGNNFIVDIEPIGRRVQIEPGTTLLGAAQASGVNLVSLCGGEGWCESCQVRVASGQCSPLTEAERSVFSEEMLTHGYRLACQAIPLSDVKIYIPPESLTAPQRLQLEGQEVIIAIDPLVKAVDVTFDPPNLSDLRADDVRIIDALALNGHPNTRIDFPLLETLSNDLRSLNWKVRFVLRESEIVAVLPPGASIYGLAVDIGTTKLAAYLVDLSSGETVAKTGAMNPQIAFGEDVISRIAYAGQEARGRVLLQTRVVEAMNEMLAELCRQANITTGQVIQAMVVGNTAMHHFIAGLPVNQLALAPYVPAASEALAIRAGYLGLKSAPGAYIQLLPNIAGYVGADHVAVILATEIWKTERTVLAIDIGTNTEITLASAGRLLSCSCASGPAFEGAHIHDGMRAAPGAIERVQIKDGEVFVFAIGSQPPVGICGSGILDAVAEMRKAGILNEKGALLTGKQQVRETAQGNEFVLVPAEKTGHGREITISRRDVNEIQLAKAAIRTGINVLLETAAISAQEVEEVLIAGAFGTYINLASAIRIGMFPDLPLERFKQIGNAAGMGAKRALISKKSLSEARSIAERAQYIELTTHTNFQNDFLNAMYL